MHNHPDRRSSVAARACAPALLLAALALVLTACIPRDHDAGRYDTLPVNEPVFKEYKGANVYLLRQADGGIVAFWGISPLGPGEQRNVQCFIEDRRDKPFRGETLPFVDPCHSAWWSRDGRFLGYNSDSADTPSQGPDLVRIPASVRDGRVVLDDAALRCLQTRGCKP